MKTALPLFRKLRHSSHFRCWLAMAIVNTALILETADDLLLILARLGQGFKDGHFVARRQLDKFRAEIRHLPVAVTTGVLHFVITVVMLELLSIDMDAITRGALLVMWIASYFVSYCLALLARREKSRGSLGERAHFVGGG